MVSIVDFISGILGIPERFSFITYIISGTLALVLLDGIISFLFGSLSSLTSRRQ